MNARATLTASLPLPGLQPNEIDRKRIERALANRRRYRYVSPTVHAINQGYLIKSPCCSRNVDPDGGVIDVALLQYLGGAKAWQLYRKDHRSRQWQLHAIYERLAPLLDELNADPKRSFWQ